MRECVCVWGGGQFGQLKFQTAALVEAALEALRRPSRGPLCFPRPLRKTNSIR